MFKKINIKTESFNEMIDITTQVKELISDSDMNDGVCMVYTPHTTSAITINEGFDPDVRSDILSYLDKIVPDGSSFAHAEGNSDAHIKSSLIGVGEEIILSNGELMLGRWQRIFFCEFDGPRNRTVYVKIF